MRVKVKKQTLPVDTDALVAWTREHAHALTSYTQVPRANTITKNLTLGRWPWEKAVLGMYYILGYVCDCMRVRNREEKHLVETIRERIWGLILIRTSRDVKCTTGKDEFGVFC